MEQCMREVSDTMVHPHTTRQFTALTRLWLLVEVGHGGGSNHLGCVVNHLIQRPTETGLERSSLHTETQRVSPYALSHKTTLDNKKGIRADLIASF